MHVRRSSYQACIWLHVDQRYRDVPTPVRHGWKLAEDNSIDYERTSGYIFPQVLFEITCYELDLITRDED